MLGCRICENSSIYGDLPFCLVAMITERFHRLTKEKWLYYILFITRDIMRTIFGSYKHLMIVYPIVYVL